MKLLINGCHIGFDYFGSQGAKPIQETPPIVLIHGLGLDRTIWHPMASAHLSDFDVILPDVRGHGESDAPTGTYSMSLLADDLAHLLQTLDVKKAIVCGHSMGGYIALAFASQYPDRLAGLGLITTNANADSEEKRAGRYEMIDAIKEHGSDALADSLAAKLSHDPDVVRHAHQLISRTKPDGLMGVLKGMAHRPDRTELLPEIDIPALVAAGEKDIITNFDEAKSMAQILSQAYFLGVPGAGHMPMVESPEELGEGLRVLIQGVIGSSIG